MSDVREPGDVGSAAAQTAEGRRAGDEDRRVRRSRPRVDDRNAVSEVLSNDSRGRDSGVVSAAADEAAIRFLAHEIERLQMMLAQAAGNIALAKEEIARMRAE